MSTWYINKRGISLNENGRYITFAFIRLFNDDRGQWLFRFWIRLPFSNCSHSLEAFITFRKIKYN